MERENRSARPRVLNDTRHRIELTASEDRLPPPEGHRPRAQGKLSISIGRVARLEEGVQLIGDLEAGLRVKGKAVTSSCLRRDASAADLAILGLPSCQAPYRPPTARPRQ